MTQARAITPLPPDFIWGVSASGWQSEGGNVDSNWDRQNAASPEQDRYGASVDFRHRYREDVALAKDLGVNTFRIGISWARIEPKKGQIDQAELAYYDDLILALKQAGIAPLITLDHFVHPGWVADQGGWTSPQTAADFVNYAALIAQRYCTDVKLWLTFNEAAVFMLFEAKAQKAGLSGLRRIKRHIVSAHRQVYDLIHALDPKAMVSSNIVWFGQGWQGALFQWFTGWLFLDSVTDKLDCLAFDYYYREITPKVLKEPLWQADLYPQGLEHALKQLARRFPGLPLLIAESGMPTGNAQPRPDGVKREDALRDCLYWTQQARAQGVNVIGYMYWSLTDNFEWGHYAPRFGLYTVNVLTDPALKRIPTAAVAAYRELIRNHGVAEGYQPVLDRAATTALPQSLES